MSSLRTITYRELLAYLMEEIDGADLDAIVGLTVSGFSGGERRTFVRRLCAMTLRMESDSMVMGGDEVHEPCTARRLRDWMLAGADESDAVLDYQVVICVRSDDRFVVDHGTRYYEVLIGGLASYSVVEFSVQSGNRRELCLIGDQDAT
jgi:hypothetical protein